MIVAWGRIGPSMPRVAQPWGGSRRVTSWVIVRSVPLIRRVVANRESPVIRTLATSCCQSAKRNGSVAKAKTSCGGRATSIVWTSSAMTPPCYLCLS
ncbi:hypothetical protein GCM10027614_06950 [Micromonospora vulcania]